MANTCKYETLYTCMIDPRTGNYVKRPTYLYPAGEGHFAPNEIGYKLGEETFAAFERERAKVEARYGKDAVTNGNGVHSFMWHDEDGIIHEIGIWSVW